MFLDQNGLITQANGDGGDKLQREGFWYEGMYLNPAQPAIPGMADYKTALQVLTDPSTGNLQRDEVKYTEAADPNDVSRDQLVSNVRACGYYGFSAVNFNILKNIVKNFSRYPNKDIAFFQDYARFIRAFKLWYLSPLLYLLDLQMLLGTVLSILMAFDPNEVDDLNLVGDLAQAQLVYPTALSFISRKLYKYLRPFGYHYMLNTYFAPSTGADTEFIALWTPILENF